MRPFILISAVSYSVVLLRAAAAPINCPIRHGGQVHNGTKTYSSTLTKLPDAPFLKRTSIDDQYCSCKGENLSDPAAPLAPNTTGFTGAHCETPFEVCPNGQLVCFNGAKCVAEQEPFYVVNRTKNGYYYSYYYYYNDTGDEGVFYNTTKFYCNCRPDSMEVTSNTDSVTPHAGVACEYKGSLCETTNLTHFTDDGVSDVNAGTWFCTNGVCNANERDVDKKCNCTDGYFGPHCEYHKQTATETITDDLYVFIPQVDQECNLTCKNGGQCLFGIKDYSDAFSEPLEKYLGTNLNGMNCACPKGWTGLLCEIPMMLCGKDQVCLNGGICTPNRNSSDYTCDCSNVVNNYTSSRHNSSMWYDRYRHHENEPHWSFGGESCHVPATKLCPVPSYEDNPLNYFCTNGGECPDVSNYATGYCTCKPGFTGPRCEYLNKSPQARNCSLTCHNGGLCFFGTKDYNSLEHKANFSVFQGLHLDGMFCACPSGYAGLQCESSVDLCSAKEQYACFNKAKCYKGNDGSMSCNCDIAGDGFNKQFAGDHCQFPATSWCTGKKRQPSSFCTNGGSCKASMDKSDAFPGCNCNTGFSGDRCEIVVASTFLSGGDNNKSSQRSPTQAKPLIIMVLILLSILGVFVLYRRRRGRRQRGVNANTTFQDLNLAHEAPPPRAAPTSPVLSTPSQVSSFHDAKKDGDDFNEVEIL